MTKIKKRLGEMLLESNLIDDIQLKAALAYQKEWGGRLGSAIIRKGFIKEEDLIAVMEKQMCMSCIPIEKFQRPSEEVMRIFDKTAAHKYGILPQSFDGKTLVIITSDPTDLKMLDDLGFKLGVRLKPLLALESDILTAIEHFYDPNLCTGELRRKSFCTMPDRNIQETIILNDRFMTDEIQIREDNPEDTSDVFNPQHAVISGIVDLLVEKGIFTRDELAEKINFRKG